MKQENQVDKVVHLLWTGGWDSTFRLLTLLIEQRKKTQPYYIIDQDRLSTVSELRAISDLKKLLFTMHPSTRNLLLPTCFRAVDDIMCEKRISESFERLRNQIRLGAQYDWLARFAYQENISNLELSILGIHGPLHQLLTSCVVPTGDSQYPSYQIDPNQKNSDIAEVFKYFKFPLFNTKKRDMYSIAEKHGFLDLMKLTTFCHRPRSDGSPCGVCNPCIIAMQEGLSWRLPYRSRFKYHFLQPFKKGKQLLQTKYPKAYRSAQWVKHNILRSST